MLCFSASHFAHDEEGRLSGTYCSVTSDQPDVGELVFRREYHSMGLSRFLFNEAIRFITIRHPDLDIRLVTPRERTRASGFMNGKASGLQINGLT